MYHHSHGTSRNVLAIQIIAPYILSCVGPAHVLYPCTWIPSATGNPPGTRNPRARKIERPTRAELIARQCGHKSQHMLEDANRRARRRAGLAPGTCTGDDPTPCICYHWPRAGGKKAPTGKYVTFRDYLLGRTHAPQCARQCVSYAIIFGHRDFLREIPALWGQGRRDTGNSVLVYARTSDNEVFDGPRVWWDV